jgi:probable phosphoglycerate mutase
MLVIGHGETVTAAAHLFLSLPASARATAAFGSHYASITMWEQQPLSWTRPDAGWRWTLAVHNDTSHLART